MEKPPNRTQLRAWFTLALRILGMWELLYAASYVMTAFDMSAGFYRNTSGYTFGGAMLHVFGHFFLAAWLLKGAPKIAEFFYPDPPPSNDTPETTPSDSDTPTI